MKTVFRCVRCGLRWLDGETPAPCTVVVGHDTFMVRYPKGGDVAKDEHGRSETRSSKLRRMRNALERIAREVARLDGLEGVTLRLSVSDDLSVATEILRAFEAEEEEQTS